MLTAAITGFATLFALILAIGAQNAFVLRQGLARQHVFWVCMVCALSDAVLITIGIAGTGTIAHSIPVLIDVLMWGGAVFLIAYGALSFGRAMRPERLEAAQESAPTLRASIVTCLALTWLNPHVYLDTVALAGAISTQYETVALKFAFGLGATSASFVFFFSLGYGARLLAPIFAKPRAWAILDLIIAAIMWSIAASLIGNALE